ncbi:MAG: ATP synthase F1 subunit gamma [Terriglobales bacterium]
MPNLLDIRRRIRSVRNTQQITQALKMVSAAKLRRAQEQALAARPYAQQLHALMAGLAAYLDPQELADAQLAGEDWNLGSLLAQREVRTRLVIVITTDSGMVGAFNANIFKAMAALGTPAGGEARYLAVGRKGRDALKRHGAPLAGEHIGLFAHAIHYDAARTIAAQAMRAFATGAVDEVVTVGNEFKSVLQQVVTRHRLLPFALPQAAEKSGEGAGRDYIFESAPGQLIAALLPRAIETQIYRSLLESLASEHAARMNAMEAATGNAGDLIDSLTLHMNRVRQAAITKEIIEVVSGASALG